ncbi:MAG: MBL fold metallo-hydrolase RNA specificity domain-containing protein, partial [Candidatus Peribacteraceae bacterium]|nr:MBL fold metallo-hydrolase RNA specificity domain-containing protein [Candidatus Peribacteraceae bacterium]
RMYRKRAEIVSINAYSGHADRKDLDTYILGVDGLQKLILVHGEIDQMEALAARVVQTRPKVTIVQPEKEQEVPL